MGAFCCSWSVGLGWKVSRSTAEDTSSAGLLASSPQCTYGIRTRAGSGPWEWPQNPYAVLGAVCCRLIRITPWVRTCCPSIILPNMGFKIREAYVHSAATNLLLIKRTVGGWYKSASKSEAGTHLSSCLAQPSLGRNMASEGKAIAGSGTCHLMGPESRQHPFTILWIHRLPGNGLTFPNGLTQSTPVEGWLHLCPWHLHLPFLE